MKKKYPFPILQIAITPTQSRWRKWEEIKKVNDLIKEYCNQTENLYYIDTVPTFLDEEGLPKTEWFIRDQLHLNETGYTVWNQLIKSEIERVKLFR